MSLPSTLLDREAAPATSPVPRASLRARLRARDRDPVLAWTGTLAVTLLALFLRLWDLSKPRSFSFDETYYAKDAWSLLHFGYAQTYVDGADQLILSGQTTGCGPATRRWWSTPSSASGSSRWARRPSG